MTGASMESAGEGSRFWPFSLDFYARPRCSEACIELQDDAAADVDLVLYLLFLAREGRQVESAEIERIDALAAPWRAEVVEPLRRLRRRLKTAVGAFEPPLTAVLRGEVKRLELAAEELQQTTLERLAPPASLGSPAPSKAEAARANLAAYGRYLGGLPEAPVAMLLQIFAEVGADAGPPDAGKDRRFPGGNLC